jgi:hypothetical protein
VPADLYQATVIVTGTDMRSRPAGIARALLEVLVKVTGNPRLAADPRAVALGSRANSLVLGFDYFDPMAGRRPHDDQGSYDRSYDLTIRFNPSRIDDAARSLGSRPWAGSRPAVVPLIEIRGWDPPWVGSFMLTVDSPSGSAQRIAFKNAAAKYGLEVRVPTLAELEARGIRFGAPLPARSVQDASAVSIVGSAEFRPAALGWVASWRTWWGAVDHEAKLSGVSLDEIFDSMVREAVTLASGSGTLD